MKNEFIYTSTLFFILLFSTTINSQNEIKEMTLGDYFGKNYSIQLLAGFSSLKVLPEYGAKNLDLQFPRITMNSYGFRFGKRNYSKTNISIFWELGISTSYGKLNIDYSDLTYTTPLEIKQELSVSNTMLGGTFGIWVPLFKQLNSSESFFVPKAIILDLKLGLDVMMLRTDNNEFGPISYVRNLEGGYIQTGSIGGKIISVSDWVLFSFGIGIDFLMTRNLMVKFDVLVGAYPVSGPANSRGEPTGPPDSWGNNSMYLIGLEFLL